MTGRDPGGNVCQCPKLALDEAVAVFEANVAAFPKSANGYDGLGEGFMVRGDTSRAIASYRQSLALDP